MQYPLHVSCNRAASSSSDHRFRPFFFNDTATPEIYTLSLHDALPICTRRSCDSRNDPGFAERTFDRTRHRTDTTPQSGRSEEHTSELQSLTNLVCRLLLEKKNAKLAYAVALCQTLISVSV